MMLALPRRKSAEIAASFSASIGGRPSVLPCALARSSPDFTRSRINGPLEHGEDAHLLNPHTSR